MGPHHPLRARLNGSTCGETAWSFSHRILDSAPRIGVHPLVKTWAGSASSDGLTDGYCRASATSRYYVPADRSQANWVWPFPALSTLRRYF